MISAARIVAAAVVTTAAVALLAGHVSAPVYAAGGETYGMREYVDAKYRFSFWYPGALQITVAATHDAKSFPGGTEVETLQVGPPGGVMVHVVASPGSTIIDEPNGHAAPIGQTKYFYLTASKRWMVAHPEEAGPAGQGAGKPADVSKKTIGGQPMLPGGARFDTTIIPLSITQFIVVQDGGGSTFTDQLARTVAPAAGASIDPAALSAALQAEAAAYQKQ